MPEKKNSTPEAISQQLYETSMMARFLMESATAFVGSKDAVRQESLEGYALLADVVNERLSSLAEAVADLSKGK